MTRQEPLETIKKLFASQKLAVLSTQKDGHPYASLVSFSFSSNLKQLFFLTRTGTKKFSNLTACPQVAVLVTSAHNSDNDFTQAQAVTVLGRARPLAEKAPLIRDFLICHPHLDEFAKAPDTVLVEVRPETYILVSRFEDVVEIKI